MGGERLKTERTMNHANNSYGKLIGASLGPGDPELITRRAWSALQSGARWLYPVKKTEERSYALSIVERGGLRRPDDAVELVFPMTRAPDALAKAWARAAAQTLALLAEGRDLVFLVEGDASTFATFGHLARVVRQLQPAIVVETIPGVSSFAAAAASTGISLAEEDETLAIIPAAYGVPVIDHLLDEFDTLILLKVKPLLDEVLDLLTRRELLATSCFIEKVGAPEERIVRDVASLRGEKVNYLSLLLVQNPKRVRGELRRGCRQRLVLNQNTLSPSPLPPAGEGRSGRCLTPSSQQTSSLLPPPADEGRNEGCLTPSSSPIPANLPSPAGGRGVGGEGG